MHRKRLAMMKMDELFFEDVAVAVETFVGSARELLTTESAAPIWIDNEDAYNRVRSALVSGGVRTADLEAVFEEILRGLSHSFFAILDGASHLAETGRVYLVDERGNHLGEGLHERYVSYLFDSGRLPSER